MPVYEYECAGCSQVHEVTQKITEAPLTTCASCGGPLKKLISLSSFALKGSGFYTTDYKRAKSAPEKTSAPCASGGCGKGECSA